MNSWLRKHITSDHALSITSARLERLYMVERWLADKRIAVTASPLAREEDHTHVVVWVKGVPFKEAFTKFPSEAMVANIALGIHSGLDY